MKIKNFTPMLDTMIAEHGLIRAAVWGRVWRYCQGPRKRCQAKHATIGEGLNVSPRTIMRHLGALIEDGYIKDHTPGLRNKPHTLSITNKAMIQVSITGVTESQSAMTESQSQGDRESHEERIKKQVKKEKRISAKAERGANPAPSPLLPTGEPSEYMFSVINRNRKLNGRNAMSKYANITQKENTEGALEKVSKAGELEKAVDWAMQNERTTRAAMCRAMISWAGNLGKQNGRGPTRNLSDEYRREADLAAAQRGIDEAKKYGKR